MKEGAAMNAANIVCLFFLALNTITDIRKHSIWWPGCLIVTGAGIAVRLYEETAALAAVFEGMLPGTAMAAMSFLFQGSLGLGDALIVMAIGTWTGTVTVLEMLFYALLMAGAFAVFLLVFMKKSRKESFPFVPFLLAGWLLTKWPG